MAIFSKTFEAITEEDVQELIDQKVNERQNIEYKSQAYGRRDDDIREMLKDIAAMANAYGGYILLGVKEDDAGLPIEISGIDDAEEERDRIYSSCLCNIEPRLFGLKIRSVELKANKAKSILAIFVPRSTRAPHMITFKGLNQFWIRHDRQKTKMSIEEIAASFFRTASILEDIREFINKRKAELVTEKVFKEAYCVIGAAPLMIRDEIIDIRDQRIRELLRDPPDQRPSGWNLSFGTGTFSRPTLHGLKIEITGSKSVELFRNGYLEARIHKNSFVLEKAKSAIVGPGRNAASVSSILDPYPLVEYPVSFFRLLKVLREYLGIENPFIAFVSLFNIKNFGLRSHPDATAYSLDLQIWDEQHLEIPPAQVSFQQKADSIAKSFVDRIWQTFGYEQAPLFDNEGNFSPMS